ncbi:aminotransferase class V-fold PLP-dependent enzyme [Saccharopolyspora gloriosae]|uniref:aminotransferase class V-fold PLP-dependent enzyme n=1 Tax=Saccharopolyspora gloriosae TaxID=455344 RepID=UPI001FB7709A|nr:aminotransferase class V-fold PLP-dependent enzyme [Saccharopolyspora gloriosae]
MAAEALDRADELATLRAHYSLPGGMVRLDGTSGGLRPRSTSARLREFVEHRWDHTGWPQFDDGLRRQARLAASAVAPLIGALPAEVSVADSASMNLFNGLRSAAALRPERRVLAVGRNCFAADHYLARSAADFAGCTLRMIDDVTDLPAQLDEEVAVLALSHVDPLSGAVRDAASITAEAHRHGALSLWDLSHSAGAVRVELRSWEADFAVGCGYRYLGGGSGSPGYSFTAQQRGEELAGTRRCGPFSAMPPTFAISDLRAGLAAMSGATPAALATKSAGLATFFLRCLQELPAEVAPVPVTGGSRGAHVCVTHRHAHYVAQELLSRGVIVDLAEPTTMRFSFAPTWLRYAEVWEAADQLRAVLRDLAERVGP